MTISNVLGLGAIADHRNPFGSKTLSWNVTVNRAGEAKTEEEGAEKK